MGYVDIMEACKALEKSGYNPYIVEVQAEADGITFITDEVFYEGVFPEVGVYRYFYNTKSIEYEFRRFGEINY